MRIWPLIKKEFWQLKRDKRLLLIATAGIVIQLIVFGYVTSLDFKNISTGILDSDRSQTSQLFVHNLENTGYFKTRYLTDFLEMKDLIQKGKIKLALYLPPNFSKNLTLGRPALIQAILDGSDANTSAIALGYLNGFIIGESKKIASERGMSTPEPSTNLRIWYNPELKSVYYMVPGTIAFVLTLITIVLTSSAIVREKEQGTFEQLILTPLDSWELLLGKILPFILISFVDVLLVIAVGVFWFRVPLEGNLFLLLSLALLYLFSSLGLGLLISAYSVSQQQVLMTMMFILMPSMILGGFIFPIEAMPRPLQLISSLVPMRYFLEIVRGIFLKGSDFFDLWDQIWPLLIISCVLFGLSVVKLKKDIS